MYVFLVLWGEQIKPIQVAFNSELRENQWNGLLFFEIITSHCFGSSEASKIDFFKNWIWKFWTFWLKKMDILVPNISRIFWTLRDPEKFQFFKKHFDAKINLILIMQKMPLTFLDVEKLSSYELFYVCTYAAPKRWESSIDFHAILN